MTIHITAGKQQSSTATTSNVITTIQATFNTACMTSTINVLQRLVKTSSGKRMCSPQCLECT